MKTMQNNYVGIDVSGEWLDTHIEPLAQARRFANNTQGLEALVQWLGAHAIDLVAMEATGGLERICAQYLRARKYEVRVFNPSRIAGFRKALGTQAKTDAVDAKVIALFALSMPNTACIEPDPALRDMKDLGARHTQLTQMIAAEKNRMTRVHHFFAKRSIDRVIDALLAERKALAREMRKIVDDVENLKPAA